MKQPTESYRHVIMSFDDDTNTMFYTPNMSRITELLPKFKDKLGGFNYFDIDTIMLDKIDEFLKRLEK